MIEVGQVWKDTKKDCYILIIDKTEGVTEENCGVLYDRYKDCDGWLHCRMSVIKNPSRMDTLFDFDKEAEGYDLFMDDGLVVNIKFTRTCNRLYIGDNKIKINLKVFDIEDAYTLVGNVSEHVVEDFIEKEKEYCKKNNIPFCL